VTESRRPAGPDPGGRLRFRLDRGGLVWGTLGTLVLNGSTTVVNFVIAVLLARLLGASGYGAFAFALAWALVLVSFSCLGLSPLIVRHVAGARATADWQMLRGILRWSNAVVLAASLLAIAVAAALGWARLKDDEELFWPFMIGLLLVVPTALTILRQAAMQGLGKIVLGRVPETLVVPGVFLLLVGAAGLSLGDRFTASWAVALNLLATVAGFLIGAMLLIRSLPAEARRGRSLYHARSWTRSAVPLFLMGLVGAVNMQVGTILLGSLAGPADAGVFAVVVRISSFAGFVFLASTYPLMPVAARLHRLGESDELRATITRVARTVFLVTVPVVLAIALLAEPLLGLFGDEFRPGASALRILLVGELVKAFFGLAGLALVMTAHESDLMRGVSVGAGINLVLAIVLVPLLGVEGAAIAAAAGAVCAYVLLAWLSRRRLGFSGAGWALR
jgi:O-antigen/teichoic acid export membrane protein